MPLVIPPGYAQAVIHMTLAGDPNDHIITLGVDVADTDYVGIANTILSSLSVASGPQDMISNDWEFSRVTLYAGQDGGPPFVAESTGPAITGALTGDTMPPNCAYLVEKLTGLAGRRNKGRLYLPGVPESYADQLGNLSAGVADDIVGAFGEFSAQAFLDNSIVGWVILHSTGESATPAPSPITAWACDPKLGTQRRRMRR